MTTTKNPKTTAQKFSVASSPVLNTVFNTPANTNDSNRLHWGVDNALPQQLILLSKVSPTHSACLSLLTDLLIGDYSGEYLDLYSRLSADYTLFGGFAFLVANGEVTHFDMSALRIAEIAYDKYGKPYPTKFWYSPIWPCKEAFELPAYSDKTGSGIVFHKDYTAGELYYPVPSYFSAQDWAQVEYQLAQFAASYLKHSANLSHIVTFKGNYSSEEQYVLTREFLRSMTGSAESGKPVITFAQSDEVPLEITTPTQPEYSNIDVLDERLVDKIVSSHRIPSRKLVGLTNESKGLGADGKELEVGYNLLNSTVIKKRANTLTSVLAKYNVPVEWTPLTIITSPTNGSN